MAGHFAAELVCQFRKKRKALPAIALTADSSILTAQSNDFGFETVFSRQIEAFAEEGDIAIGFTTSDASEEDTHSKNILLAFETAKTLKLNRIGFFSQKTKNLLSCVDASIIVPSGDTALIQEVHQAVIHIVCELIEMNLV